MMAGPLGAVVGGAFQHVLSSQTRPRAGTGRMAAQGEQIFVSNLVAIMTKICMADGNISDQERKTIHTFFSKALGYHGTEMRFIDALMDETERVNPDLHEVCKAFDQFAGREQRLLLLDALLISCDGANPMNERPLNTTVVENRIPERHPGRPNRPIRDLHQVVVAFLLGATVALGDPG